MHVKICFLADNCTENILSPSAIEDKSKAITTVAKYQTGRSIQVHFPDIKIKCNGNLTEFVFGAKMMDGAKRNRYPKLQIWQNINGSLSIKHIANLTEDIHAIAGAMNLYKYLINTPMPVHYGDYLGIFQPKTSESKIILYYQEYNGPSNYDANNEKLLSNDYPLVSAIINSKLVIFLVMISISVSVTSSSLYDTTTSTYTSTSSDDTRDSTGIATTVSIVTIASTLPIWSYASRYTIEPTSWISMNVSTTCMIQQKSSYRSSVSPVNDTLATTSSLPTVIAGVIVPMILVLAVIAVLVTVVVYRRRHKRAKMVSNGGLVNPLYNTPTPSNQDGGSELSNPLYYDGKSAIYIYTCT